MLLDRDLFPLRNGGRLDLIPNSLPEAKERARCFRCQMNYNPIDLVMTGRQMRFLDAVRYLAKDFAHKKLSDSR